MEEVKRVTRYATKRETLLIQRAMNATAKIRALCEQREKFYETLGKLSGSDAMIAEVNVDGVTETRTFVIGSPKGKYVVYAPLDFVVNRRLSKDDSAGLAENLQAQTG